MNSAELIEISNRLTDLEIRLTHQDDTIDALNETVVQQQIQIDNLINKLSHAHRRITELDEMATIAPQMEPPPPHY